MRRARLLLVPFLVGALSVGAAWAGAGLVPAPAASKAGAAGAGGTSSVFAARTPRPVAGGALRPGEVYVGAAKVNIFPQPPAGRTWEKQGCATLEEDAGLATATHVPDFRSVTPENPDCIYLGGYGLGPMNPMLSVDPTGLWVRSVAISDGVDALILTILDGTSYLGDYRSFCDDCGAFELAQSLGAQLGVSPNSFILSSTHSHTAPDFIGGWGGVPQWYMDQVEQAIRDSVTQAFNSKRPATIEAGESLARGFNNERRDTYRSAEDPVLTWFRAVASDRRGRNTSEVIATVGGFSAHPTTRSNAGGVGHADFPVLFENRVEQRFGGVGLYFMAGLGNMSARQGTDGTGIGVANLIPPVGQGIPVGSGVRVSRTMWNQPITNQPLKSLGTVGFFDRTFQNLPATITTGKSTAKPCTSASEISVNTGITAAKVGSLVVSGAPGEIFSNLSNSIKERNPDNISMPIAQANDGLGYIIQEFETDFAARQALGFVGGGFFEYEDAYALDGCFGDKVLEETIKALNALPAS